MEPVAIKNGYWGFHGGREIRQLFMMQVQSQGYKFMTSFTMRDVIEERKKKEKNIVFVKKFDPERGFRLATYAMWWIRAAIQEYVLRSWSLVKMGTTAAQKKLFFNLRRLKGEMKAIEDGDLTPEHVTKIATKLGVKEEEVTSMNRRMGHGGDASLNVSIGGEDGSSEWQDWLQDDTETQEEALGQDQEHNAKMELLKTAMSALNEREQDIISKRRLADKPMTLEELAIIYGVSRERIRQIEARAFEKLQEAMINSAQSSGLIEGH